jgi:hypothetical protein
VTKILHKRVWISISFLALASCVAAAPVRVNEVDPIDRLRLSAKNSAELHIFHFPNYAETFTALTPSTLRSMATYRSVVRKSERPTVFSSLSEAINQTRAFKTIKYVDVRWGCELYSANRRWLGSFYIAGRPILGPESHWCAVVNNRKIEVNDALFRWFEESFRRPQGR